MSSSGISSSSYKRMFGLGTGLDIDDIVKKLMMVEQAPIDRLKQNRQIIQWQQEDYRSINSRLKELSDSLFNIRMQSTYQQRKITSSNDSIVSATTVSGSAAGTYKMTVHQLADSLHLNSTQIAKGNTLAEQFAGIEGNVSFTITHVGVDGDENVTKTFSYDTTTTNMSSVAADINSSGLGLKAFFDENLGRLFISSDETGKQAQYTIDADPQGFLTGVDRLNISDDQGSNVLVGVTYTGQNAKFDLNGAMGLEQSSNQFTINGVTYTLKQESPANTVTIQVAKDTDSIINSIKTFIDKYNEIIKSVNSKLSEKRNYNYAPLTEAQKDEMDEKEIEEWQAKARSGLLRSDSLLSQAVSFMRRAFSSVVSNTESSKYDSAASIGIESGQWFEGGVLKVNETKLRKALEEAPESVMALFTNSTSGDVYEEKGIGQRLDEALDNTMARIGERAGSGTSVVDESPLGRQMALLDERIETLEERLRKAEERYYSQFSAMESAIAQLNNQSSWMSQAFNSKS